MNSSVPSPWNRQHWSWWIRVPIAWIATGPIDYLCSHSRPPKPSKSIVGDSNPPKRVVGFPVPGVRKEAVRILEAEAPELLIPVADGDIESKWRRNREIAEVFSSYLRGENFRYTLDLRDFVQSRGSDPIVQFLTEYRFGHCEYFASALAGMCRSMGVEARVATGFRGD